MISPTSVSGTASAARADIAGQPFNQTLFGLPCMTLSCGNSQVVIAQQGAQILSWRDANGRERLYLSPETGGAADSGAFESAVPPQAIRGGMPICFPQFSGRGPLPKHGFARASAWTLDAISERHDGASSAVFSLRDSARSFAIWPESFLVQMTVTLEPARLIATLSVSNPGDKPWSFSGALHTYFRVDDIAETALIGLQSTHYQDATANNVEVREQARSVTIDAELDRVYMSPPLSLELAEHGKPSLYIEQSGFIDTVVWNPGPVLAAGFKDFPAGDWRHMLCIEAANAARPVVVQAGETWIGSQTLSVA